jgi:hypothetical protein
VLNSWQQEYTKLTDYINSNPEIKIEDDYIRLPQNVRAEFYRLFNRVRAAFVEMGLPSRLDEAENLSQNYKQLAKEVTSLLGLEGISMPGTLQTYLTNPIEVIITPLFGPLFDLLRGKINSSELEQKFLDEVEKICRYYYLSGYEKWAILSLLELIQPDMLLQSQDTKVRGEEAALLIFGGINVPVENPEKTKHLSFKDSDPVKIVMPDFIVHAPRWNKYLSFRTSMSKPMSATDGKAGSREWLPLSYFASSWTTITLIYMADDFREIALVADNTQICRPDIIVACLGVENREKEKVWEQVAAQHESLKPMLGTFIITRDAYAIPTNHPDNIRVIQANLDHIKLNPVFEILDSCNQVKS